MEQLDKIPKVALVICAHPDDVDFGAAGTIAKWTAQGSKVTYCIVTDGAAGGFDRNVTRQEMAVLRESEQRCAAKMVGVDDVRFLGYSDGSLEVSMDLRKDISRVIRQVKPDLILCPSPERWWERLPASHPDHLAAGEASLYAIYPDARNPFAHVELLEKEGLEPWTVTEVLVMASPRMNVYVDVTDSFDDKIKALRCHASQHSDPDEMETRIRGWLSDFAKSQGMGEGKYIEAFQRVTIG